VGDEEAAVRRTQHRQLETHLRGRKSAVIARCRKNRNKDGASNP